MEHRIFHWSRDHDISAITSLVLPKAHAETKAYEKKGNTVDTQTVDYGIVLND